MKEWNGTWEEAIDIQAKNWFEPEHTLLFDIETTGLSPRNSMVYMIGYCYFNSQWNYRILFNDDGRSEYAILSEFLSVLKDFTTILHFNGDHFDVPYLVEKCRQYQSLGLPLSNTDALNACTSLDLYKVIKPYRNGLSLPNLKLQTLEKALGINRKDTYNGGELIQVYHKYLNKPSDAMEHLLFQHNYEDIKAMVPMLSLLNFQGLASHSWDLKDILQGKQEYKLLLQLNNPLPIRYICNTPNYSFHGFEYEAVITIPIVQEELKYFLADWKDYYYLPIEDKVIHKSIAAYVDNSCKEKAKKSNAYIKKEGRFLAIPSKMKSLTLHIYKHNYADTEQYVELTDIEKMSSDFWLNYINCLF